MSIALFIESEAGVLEGLPAYAQTVIFNYDNEAQAYHRISNGSKGRGQVWAKVTDTNILPDTLLTTKPVGVVITERDLAMVAMGLVTNICAKAMYANESAESLSAPIPHKATVEGLMDRLIAGDSDLSDFIVDKRRVNSVSITGVSPIISSAEPVEVAEVATYENVEVVAMETKISELALSMISVPDKKWANEYINRKVDNVQDFAIYDYAKANAINVLIEGQAGSGKTISVQSYASARGLRYFNISSNGGIDPSQLFGRWIPKSDGNGYQWQDGAVTLLFRHGGVLLINEVNFLPTRVSTVLFSGLDYRREIQLLENGGEVIKAHKDLLIVADMNAGYKGTQELNQAFSDRFGIKLEFPYDNTIENKVVKNKALLTLAHQLREQYDKEELSTPISTRSLVAFMDNANNFGVEFAITSFTNGFNKDERGAVRLACETHKDNIAVAMGVKTIAHPVSVDESYVSTFEMNLNA